MANSPERVFVSSTCYDLVDLRAELRAYLLEMGLDPLLSEHVEFGAETDRNSIETCLVKLEESDVVLCIIGTRYGGKLLRAGYPDLSATHLEYRRAMELGKPLHFFVRDKTLGAHAIWKKQGREPGEFLPVSKADSEFLFPWISEHERLSHDDQTNNWVHSFRDSVELRQRVGKILAFSLQKREINQAIDEGTLPLLDSWARTDANATVGQRIKYTFAAINIGLHPVFRMRLVAHRPNISVNQPQEGARVNAGDGVTASFSELVQRPLTRESPFRTLVKVDFTTIRGLRARQIFQLQLPVNGMGKSRLVRVEIIQKPDFEYGPPDE